MPLYDYVCIACRNRFDLMRPMGKAYEIAACPRCGSEAQRTPAGGSKVEILMEGTDPQPSAGGAAAVATSAPEERAIADSKVDHTEDTVPFSMPQITEYQPSGSNLWYVRDWGIASMFGYLRDKHGMKPAEAGEDHQIADQPRSALSEMDSSAGAVEIANRHPSASEWRSATSVMPWLEEMDRDSSKAEEENRHISSKETDRPGLRPRQNRPIVHLAWANSLHTGPARDRVADAASHRPAQEKADEEFPENIVEAAWRRQGGRCAKCGRWLIWSHRDKDSSTGAWELHYRIPAKRGGRPILANCVLLCSCIADCHFNIGHGGVGWSHYAPLGDSALVFLSDGLTTAAPPTTRARRKKSLLKAVLGIPQTKKP